MNDIFISYSRKDTEFVRRLFTTLEEQKHQSWVDWKGIDYSSKWWEEICSAIEHANNFVFIISPDALNSKYCHDEIIHARKFNKRIIPFTYIDLDEEKWQRQPLTDQALDNWAYLKSLQFISYPKLNDFDKAVAALVETADKDPEYIQAHTELLAAAHEWKKAGKSPGFLLRDDRMTQAEEWLKQAISASKDPAPTQEQQDFIAASRKLAATHIRQLKQFIAAAVALVTLVILFAMASTILFNQASHTRDQIATAILAREKALAAEATTVSQVATATNEQGKAQNAAATATIAQGAAVYAQATAVAQADSAQKDAQIARTQVAIAGITLTSVPPTLTAVASAIADAQVEQAISLQLANASLLLANFQIDDALKIADRLVQTYPDKVLVYIGRGLINAYRGQHEKAVADFDKALQLNPSFANGYYNRGISYTQLTKYQQAISDFTRALELDPSFAPVYNSRGYAYALNKQDDKALVDFNIAIQLDPMALLPYYNRGTTYNDLEEYDKAIIDLTKAIEIDPKYTFAYYNRGLAYHAIKQYDKALIDFNHAIQLNPLFALAFYNRGVNYNTQAKYDEAISDFSQTILLSPPYALAYLMRGASYLGKHEYAKALADWTQYEKLGGALVPEYIQMRAEAEAGLSQTPTTTPQ